MINAAGLAVMLAALAAAAAAPEVKGLGWRLVDRDSKGADFIQPPYAAGPFRRVKVRQELFKPDLGRLSILTLEEYDCTKQLSRVVSATTYARNNLQKPIRSMDTPDARFNGTENSLILPLVCGKKPLPPANRSTIRPGPRK